MFSCFFVCIIFCCVFCSQRNSHFFQALWTSFLQEKTLTIQPNERIWGSFESFMGMCLLWDCLCNFPESLPVFQEFAISSSLWCLSLVLQVLWCYNKPLPLWFSADFWPPKYAGSIIASSHGRLKWIPKVAPSEDGKLNKHSTLFSHPLTHLDISWELGVFSLNLPPSTALSVSWCCKKQLRTL